jgi:hypothetical protein
MNLTFPTSAALKLVEQAKLPLLTKDDPTFALFPTVSEDTDELQWEQMDTFTGIQAARGLNGEPGRVKNVGFKRMKAEVGYYGDFAEIDELEITKRRKLGTFGDTATINDLIMFRQDYLLAREIDRLRLMVWTLLQTGAYSAFSLTGALIHTDTYAFQSVTAAVPWSNLALATPLADMRALKLRARGFSTYYDSRATMYVNLKQCNYLLNNTNAADLYGKRVEAGSTLNSLSDLNKILAANDCPKIEVYDEGYFPEGTTPGVDPQVQFLADGKAVVIGPRKSGAPVGDVCQVRNANNADGEPGSYTIVSDSLGNNVAPVPRKVRIDRGWNGGLRIYFPSSVAYMNV